MRKGVFVKLNAPYAVVIPAWNAQDTIGEALDSVLNQDPRPADIVVVDDGSTDDTAQVVRRYGERVRLVQQANQGCGGATNTGLACVASPLVAFLDADDVWLPGKAAMQLMQLEQFPELAGVFCRAGVFKGSLDAPVMLRTADVWGRTTLMMRTDAARMIGPMIDPPGGRGDMVDWLTRAREQGFSFEMMPREMALRRIRPGSLSYGHDAQRDRGYIDVIRRALERRRTQA
jgi:glycosyltransferase involved in cell wall biosynthesis